MKLRERNNLRIIFNDFFRLPSRVFARTHFLHFMFGSFSIQSSFSFISLKEKVFIAISSLEMQRHAIDMM